MVRLLLFISISLALSSFAQGDVVLVTTTGSIAADLDGTTDTDGSSFSNDTLSARSEISNSQTTFYSQSDLAWTWDQIAQSLTGNSVLTAEKTTNARQGGDHIVNSDFTFTFELDETTDLSFSGLWGFNNVNAGGDSLTITLSDGSSNVYSGATTSSTGLTSDSFSFASTLGPGNYSLNVNASLTETINNQQIAQAGWSFSTFEFTTAAVPEPSALTVLMLLTACLGLTRSKR